MDKEQESAVIVVGMALLGIPALLFLGHVWRGYVFSLMWQWFAVPLGAPPLSIPHAIGVAVTVSFLTFQKTGLEAKNPDAKNWTPIAVMFGIPLVVLVIGSITRQFM